MTWRRKAGRSEPRGSAGRAVANHAQSEYVHLGGRLVACTATVESAPWRSDRCRLGAGEEALAARLVDRLEGAGFDAFAMPPTTIAELGDWMAQADLVISGDTGPLHLAGAVCDQVMGIFRRSDGRRWLPPGERHCGYVLSPEGELEEIN